MIECPSLAVWRATLINDLEAEQDRAFREHAESCGPCQMVLDQIVREQEQSSRLLVQAAEALDTPRVGIHDTPGGGLSDTGSWLNLSSGSYRTIRPEPANSAAPSPPVVPGYEILKELGRGGMGVVYLARQVHLHRLVALKMVRGGQFASAEDLARFRAEAQAVAQLQHPNIVTIFEIGSLEGLPYFSLEYLPDGSLAQHLQGRPLPARTAAALVQPLASAVHAAHLKGILHRDLKPANVLLEMKNEECRRKNEKPEGLTFDIRHSSFGIPKLTDFGLAKRFDQEGGATQTGVIMGTPDYMAPEQARGLKQIGPGMDLFALGSILYEMLTGRPPFRAAEPLETLQRVIHDEPVPPSRLMPGLPRDLETICLKCLHKEPPRRYLSAQDLADDLRRFLVGEPIHARPVGSIERALKWARRKPALAGLLATLLLTMAALSATVILLWQANQVEATLRVEAQTNEQKALVNERQAVRYQQKADQAVNDLFVAVTEHDLLRPEAMREIRLLLLEKAFPYYQAFREERGDDPALIVQTAANQKRIALIFTEKGEWEKADSAYKEAVSLLEKVGAAKPATLPYQLEWAMLRREWGDVQIKLGRFAEAKENLRQAIARLRKLAEEHPQDEGVSFVLASALTSQASVLGGLEHFQEALQLHQKREAANPGTAANRVNLATTWTEFATWQVSQGQRDAADKSYGEAISLQERLVADHPDTAEYRHYLATMLGNRGLLATETGRLNQARDYLERAAKLYAQLCEQFPAVGRYRYDEALILNSLGMMLCERGQATEAAAHYEKAQTSLEKLARKHPTVPDYQVDLGPILINRGVLAFKAGQARAALSLFTQAVDSLAPILARWPDHRKARHHLRDASKNRAAILDILGNYQDGAKAWEQAVAHDDQNLAIIRIGRLRTLARAGDPARVLAEAWTLHRSPLSKPDRFRLAQACAVASHAASQNAKLSEEFADIAVTTLDAMKGPNDKFIAADHAFLWNDPELKLLRSYEKFQKLCNRPNPGSP